MNLSAEGILHNAVAETSGCQGKWAFVSQLLSAAERYLKGDTITPGEFSKLFFYSPEHIDIPSEERPSHTCADFPDYKCPACSFFNQYLRECRRPLLPFTYVQRTETTRRVRRPG